MQVIGSSLATGATTSVIQTTCAGTVWIAANSTNWNSTTLTLQISFDNSTWITLTVDGTAQTFTANNMERYDLPGGVYIRGSVSGSATALTVRADGLTMVVL